MTGGHYDAEAGVITQQFECRVCGASTTQQTASLQPDFTNDYVVAEDVALVTQNAAGFWAPGARYRVTVEKI